jgi:hypothetical protein
MLHFLNYFRSNILLEITFVLLYFQEAFLQLLLKVIFNALDILI